MNAFMNKNDLAIDRYVVNPLINELSSYGIFENKHYKRERNGHPERFVM